MRIQRFLAKDSRQAMREVREAMGGDAVILSSQRVDGGVEVVAAADYDEKLLKGQQRGDQAAVSASRPTVDQIAPQSRATGVDGLHPTGGSNLAEGSHLAEGSYNEMRRELTQLRGMVEQGAAASARREKESPRRVAGNENLTAPKQVPTPPAQQASVLRAGLLNRLVSLGLGRELCMQLADKAPLETDMDSCWQLSLKRLGAQLVENGDDILNNGGCVAVVGPTGVGKTTSVAKLAARFAMRHGRKQVALITTDCYRIGGQEQIYTFGRILGVPVRLATSREELTKAIAEFADRKLVMIDTAGMSQRDMDLNKQFQTLQGAAPDMKIYLTLSATSQLPILDEVVRKFGAAMLAGAIVTKVDETASLGPVLSALVRHRLPVAYVGNGQRVPEDIQLARATELVKHAVRMMETFDLEAVAWDPSLPDTDVLGGMAVNAGVA